MPTPLPELRRHPGRVPNAQLRRLHADSGMSVRELSKAIGIKQYDFMRAEFGRAIPVRSALRIAHYFNTTVEELWAEMPEGLEPLGKRLVGGEDGK